VPKPIFRISSVTAQLACGTGQGDLHEKDPLA
jgi:hypothetical protein